jgi:ABC-type transporter Mla subunit MlaD
VTYLGVDFGHVERLAIRDGKVIVELRVHRSDAALRQGDRVRLRTQGIIGDRLLDVVPGPPGAPLLGPGDTLFSDAPSREPSGEALEALMRALLLDSAIWSPRRPASASPPP